MFNEMKRNKMNCSKSKQSLQSIQTKRNNLKYSFIVSYYLLLKLPLNNCLKRIFNKVKLVFFHNTYRLRRLFSLANTFSGREVIAFEDKSL